MHVEKDFNDYWKPILKERGLDPRSVPEPIKCLLYEYHFLMTQALKVYEHISNGTVNNLNWASWAIIEEYEKNRHKTPLITQKDIDNIINGTSESNAPSAKDTSNGS